MIKFLAIIMGIVTTIIIGSLTAPVWNALWSVPDTIVEQTNDEQLQTSYDTGKTMINAAEDAQDTFDFAKMVWGLVLFILVPVMGFSIGYELVTKK